MPEPLEISVDGTPNPNAVKFTLNRPVATQGKTYRNPLPADAEAWAKALLGITGVVGVFGIHNFISVNKSPEAEWDAIIPQAEEALKRLFQ